MTTEQDATWFKERISQLDNENQGFMREVALLDARIARLKGALKPFAYLADAYAAVADKEGRKPHSDGHRVSIGLGECRAAREALSQFRSNP